MKCPVCGEEVEMFDICDNCDWQNSGPEENNLAGPNKVTLDEAKEAYKKTEKVV